MSKAILTYTFKCSEFDGETYQKKNWILTKYKIIDKFLPPFVNLDEGWYIDKDKRIAYFYTKEFDDKNELKNYTNSISPLEYDLECFVKYEYQITDYDNEIDCMNALDTEEVDEYKKSILSTCLCEEGVLDDCIDEHNKFMLPKLNTCIKANNKHSMIKIVNGPILS